MMYNSCLQKYSRCLKQLAFLLQTTAFTQTIVGRHLLLAKNYAIECCLVYVCVLYVKAALAYARQVHSLWVFKMLLMINSNFFYDFEYIYICIH